MSLNFHCYHNNINWSVSVWSTVESVGVSLGVSGNIRNIVDKRSSQILSGPCSVSDWFPDTLYLKSDEKLFSLWTLISGRNLSSRKRFNAQSSGLNYTSYATASCALISNFINYLSLFYSTFIIIITFDLLAGYRVINKLLLYNGDMILLNLHVM